MSTHSLRDLQRWFAKADETGKPGAELCDWEGTFRQTFRKWEDGVALSEEEIEFLVEGFTALSDTPEDFFKTATAEPSNAGFNMGTVTEELRRTIEEILNRNYALVQEAWKELKKAFVRQVTEAENSRRRGHAADTRALNEFNAAVTKLRQAVKKHSGTPAHRPQEDPERAREIHRMRREGKTYGEIKNVWNRKNPKRTIKANQAQRIHERHRERGQNWLRGLFRETFKQPRQKMPR